MLRTCVPRQGRTYPSYNSPHYSLFLSLSSHFPPNTKCRELKTITLQPNPQKHIYYLPVVKQIIIMSPARQYLAIFFVICQSMEVFSRKYTGHKIWLLNWDWWWWLLDRVGNTWLGCPTSDTTPPDSEVGWFILQH